MRVNYQAPRPHVRILHRHFLPNNPHPILIRILHHLVPLRLPAASTQHLQSLPNIGPSYPSVSQQQAAACNPCLKEDPRAPPSLNSKHPAPSNPCPTQRHSCSDAPARHSCSNAYSTSTQLQSSS